MNQGRLFDVLFRFYLGAVIVATGRTAIKNLHRHDNFSIADWLINYHGGFVRRGLVGEVILRLSPGMHISPEGLVLILQLVLYGLLYMAIWRLMERMQWEVWQVLIAFSPATLGFALLSPAGCFRKELLFLTALATLMGFSNQWTERKAGLFLTATAVLLGFSHEGLAVYWPYMVVGTILALGNIRRGLAVALIPTVLFLIVILIVRAHPGNYESATRICSAIGNQPIGHKFDSSFCGGSIYALAVDERTYHNLVVSQCLDAGVWEMYLVMGILCLLPCCLAVYTLWRKGAVAKKSLRLFMIGSAASMAGSSLLFYYGTDWGRWIYIHSLSMMLLLFYIARNSATEIVEPRAAWAMGPRRFVVAVLILVYLTVWNLPFFPAQPYYGYAGRVYLLRHPELGLL
jgi:hypothetical protein